MGRVENVFPCTHWHLRKCLLVIVQISSHPNNSLITQALWCPVYFITFIKILLSITKLSAKLSQVQFWKPVRTNCPQSNKNWTAASSKITLFYDDVLLHISIIVFTFVTVYKTLDFKLKAFCVNNVYFLDSSYQKNFKFQSWFLLQNSINLNNYAKGCFWGTEYTPHRRWQFFQQLGSHDK